MSDCSDMSGKKEFGVKDDMEVTEVGAPWDGRELKVDWGRDRGRRLVKSIASVLRTLMRNFHLVKYRRRVVEAWVSRLTRVSVRQD